MIGLKVPKKEANRIRLILLEKSFLDHHWKIRRFEENVYLPLNQTPCPDFLKELGLNWKISLKLILKNLKKGPVTLKTISRVEYPLKKWRNLKNPLI